MDVKSHIKTKALELFMRYGIKSMSMDDIARSLGMSKKTLYQHFEDKDALIQAAVEVNIQEGKESCLASSRQSANAIQEVFNIMEDVIDQLKDVNPLVLYELNKFHASAYKAFEDYKHHFILDMLQKNIKRGISEELYRSDLNIPFTARYRLDTMMYIFSPERSSLSGTGASIPQVMLWLTELYLYGIATPKGNKLIQKSIQKFQKK